jgi:hypothetical protein
VEGRVGGGGGRLARALRDGKLGPQRLRLRRRLSGGELRRVRAPPERLRLRLRLRGRARRRLGAGAPARLRSSEQRREALGLGARRVRVGGGGARNNSGGAARLVAVAVGWPPN